MTVVLATAAVAPQSEASAPAAAGSEQELPRADLTDGVAVPVNAPSTQLAGPCRAPSRGRSNSPSWFHLEAARSRQPLVLRSPPGLPPPSELGGEDGPPGLAQVDGTGLPAGVELPDVGVFDSTPQDGEAVDRMAQALYAAAQAEMVPDEAQEWGGWSDVTL